ncbi:diguanylate cyclase domain-containing protein [Thioalkalivibrio sulfidiphilus]|uniref:diguanylate cyclase domain-containing protein n=1 Tax=Thioalkalivibrio sulfidiphilus TaxID=1033854 RepID=UPI003B33E09F
MIKRLAELIFAKDKRPSLALVRRSALLTLVLLCIYAAVSLYYLTALQSAMTQVSEVHNRKVELIHRMSNVVQARSLQLYSAAFKDDPWFRDERFMEFRAVAVEFIDLRDRLIALGLEPRERALLDDALDIIRITAPLQEDIMQRILGGEQGQEVWSAIVDQDLPLEMALLNIFQRLAQTVQDNAYAAQLDSEASYHTALRVIAVVTLLIIISVLAGALRVLVRLRSIENSLNEEKELAIGTLNNIADGVIVTDSQGFILSMNRAAGHMTGLAPERALGESIDEVYRLSRPSGDPCMPPGVFATLLSGVATRAHRYQTLEDRQGVLHYVEETVSPIFDENDQRVRVSFIFRDVSADLAHMEQMTWDAQHDHLTGALNRRAFEVELQRACLDTRQGRACTLIYLDLDDFKHLNDTHGHHAGDAFLVALVRTMSSCIRRHDSLARLGGDEFAILLNDCDLNNAQQIVDNLARSISELTFTFEGRALKGAGASIGVHAITSRDTDPETVMRRVDEACYVAKRRGKNQVCIVA